MEKVEWQERSRRQRHHRHEGASFLGVKKDIILAVLVAVITTFFLSSQWHAPSPYHEHPHAEYQLNAADLEYGLAQCALNQQRPVVDYNLASSRLAASRSSTGKRTILHNATLINGDGTVTHDTVIVIQDGIFTSVSSTSSSSSSLTPPPSPESGDVVVVDLRGRVVTPGLVDMHSHAGVRETPQLWATEDVTEISAPLTPWARAIDGFKPHDAAIPVIASGGVTTSLVLTGAKNPISGEGFVIKMKRADSVLGMLLDAPEAKGSVGVKGKPQRYLKMAMGENQKRQFENVAGGPATRLGESYWFRKAYDTAARVKREQDRWCEAAAASTGGRGLVSREYPRSLEWQTLVDVLRGDLRVNVHGYETEDVLAMFDHADEFGFNITALHHALHADLLIDQIKARDIAVVGFSDIWGDKKELYNVSSYLPARVAESGIPMVLTRDHPAEHGQWLIYEAQIAHHYGLSAEDTVKSIIGHPARLIGLDNRLGFVRPGYDADLVVWDRHLLQVGATPLEVYIDGVSVARASESVWKASESAAFTKEAPPSRSDDIPGNECKSGQSDIVVHGLKVSFIGDDGIRSEEPETGNVTVVVREGRIVCVGGSKCETSAKQAVEDSIPSIDLQDGYMLPGLTIVTRQHGLTEMHQEPSTSDGASAGEEYANPLSSRFGIKFDGIHLGRAYRSGVTRVITPPLTTGFFHGISTLFRSGAKSVLDDGAIVEPSAALHFTIGHDAKSPQTPSITSQISKLRDLLTVDKHLHPIYESAANGEIAVVIHTNNKDVIAHMVALKQETGAHIAIMGGAEAHLIASELAEADVPVIVAPFWGCEPLFWDGRNCLPGPPLTDRLGPQVLIDAGVKVGISNWEDKNNHIRNSIWEAGWVAGPGNRSLALDLVSKNIEDILQLPRSRDFVVYEGDPFNFGARVALIFEEGKVQSCYPSVDELV
ncbi:composite domain of metallo-dependent hydrolase [Annulohypoxylon truncatum]|uniref:composite domain of metallo-dependent hydrolase n=1 Tax=Annulohypoxylon truncatum TaxID=327061 RepID=UPI0020080710|nr:composite domain of metallo-dependent hydrolase [Annulohypoxylon truncatum]KAI1206475.1 composite domain of metallo-dependent hydrolase [Annulohypoxylon truncatum]